MNHIRIHDLLVSPSCVRIQEDFTIQVKLTPMVLTSASPADLDSAIESRPWNKQVNNAPFPTRFAARGATRTDKPGGRKQEDLWMSGAKQRQDTSASAGDRILIRRNESLDRRLRDFVKVDN
jgi:hypothetical protein